MKKLISIIGSTGSVGISSLKIIEKKKSLFKVNLLLAKKNYSSICRQIKKFKPNYFVVIDQTVYQKIKKKFKKNKVKILSEFNSNTFRKKNDITISAIPGIAGLKPTLEMIKCSKKILIANKESIICGWNLIKNLASKNKTQIIPVDSEHYSILKLAEHHKMEEIEKIYLTASGGPFLKYKISRLKKIKPKEALKHPKWKMGKKISIDSSTLMNKILELIEAQKLFNIPKNKIDILIHPNSLVHAIIEFKNGLVKLLYHQTSMIIPLANAIFEDNVDIKDFYISKNKNFKNHVNNLTFEKVNEKIFPIIKIKNKVNEYPSSPIIVNAANEILVDQFLQKKIPFLSIFKVIMVILKDRNYRKYAIKKPKNVDQIIQIDMWARKTAYKKIKRYSD